MHAVGWGLLGAYTRTSASARNDEPTHHCKTTPCIGLHTIMGNPLDDSLHLCLTLKGVVASLMQVPRMRALESGDVSKIM
jgi:hypothetical protein